MALNFVIRRTASRVVPLAGRLIGASQRYNHHSSLFAPLNCNSGLCEKVFRRALPSFLHHYSSRPASAESFIRILYSEIDCARDDGPLEVEIPEDSRFKIDDTPAMKCQGETIPVEVHLSDGHDGEDGDDDQEDQLPLVVGASKSNGPYSEFGSTVPVNIEDPYDSEVEIPVVVGASKSNGPYSQFCFTADIDRFEDPYDSKGVLRNIRRVFTSIFR